MALVLVLVMLVLMLGVTLAFFSQALLDRSISSSSAANTQADLLAHSASEMVVGDILQEIQAGSTTDPLTSASRRVSAPLTVSTTNGLLGTNVLLSAAPSMVLQRVAGTNGIPPATLVKQSLSGRAFFRLYPDTRIIPEAERPRRAPPPSAPPTPRRGGARFPPTAG